MIISAEISLYPLVPDYEEPITDFIRLLHQQPGLRVATNHLSTQVTGDYDNVMDALKHAIRPTFAGKTTCTFVLKILNVAIEPCTPVEV